MPKWVICDRLGHSSAQPQAGRDKRPRVSFSLPMNFSVPETWPVVYHPCADWRTSLHPIWKRAGGIP
jgi:hypothetical protein